MSTHMVIGDAHARPGISNERFEWAGRMALDLRPDVIIDMGDWADLPSLSSYDKGKREFEGRRLSNDILVAKRARELFERPIEEYNQRRRKNGKKQYKPRKVHLRGNHENRINVATSLSPELEGSISTSRLCISDMGWEEYGFLDTIVIDNICYSHYFGSGVMMRPIGGEYPACSLIKKQYASCVAGHLHLRDFAERTTADGRRLTGLLTGCYLAEDQREHWAGAANEMWWKGLIMLNVHGGAFDPSFYSIQEIKERWGA